MSQVANQITRLTTQITTLTNEIAAIDAATITNAEVAECINKRKGRLQQRLNALTNLKNNLTTTQTNETAGFSAGQQTTVDGINTLFSNNYSNQLNRLKCMEEAKKTNFFTLYATADNDFVREELIKSFFQTN
jgi:hypothetical protein